MSVFYDNSITDVGRMLIAETQTGNAKFKPTKIVIGSGFMPTGKTSRTMTAVAEPVAELELNKGLKTPDGSAVFGAAFTNKDITQPFYYRELALYAKAVYDDGTEGVETLYSYGNAGDNAELIPAYSANTIVERQLDLLVYIGNDTVVSLEIATGVYVDTLTFNNAIDDLEYKIAQITPNGINAMDIGTNRIEIPENADLNEILTVDGYKCALNATAMTLKNCPVQTAFIMDVVSSTGDWEAIDPNEHSYVMQRIHTIEGVEYFRSVHSDGAGNTTYEEWKHTYSTHQPPTPAEIGAVSSLGLVKESDLVAWADKQTIGGAFLVSPEITTVNVPENHWYIGHLDVTSSGKCMTITGLNTFKQHMNLTRNGAFVGWFDVITAAGGTINGVLDFNNFGDFYVLKKGRTLADGKTHFMTMGVSIGGSAAIEHYHNTTPDFAGATIDGRLELRSVPNNRDALILREDNQDGNIYCIFGEHNKPDGSYTGNGDATAREIETGSVWNELIIWWSNYMTIVTYHGGVAINYLTGAVTVLDSTKIHHRRGKLMIATDDASVNASGKQIEWKVL